MAALTFRQAHTLFIIFLYADWYLPVRITVLAVSKAIIPHYPFECETAKIPFCIIIYTKHLSDGY